MVGTPKSTGCGTCRKRKVRCGKEWPDCRNCTSAGWVCDGYLKRWKFVEEGSRLAAHYKGNKRYLLEEAAWDTTPRIKNSESSQNSGVKEEYSVGDQLFQVSISRLPASQAENQCNLLLHILTDPESRREFPLRSHGEFYQFIPNRLGINPALDDAVSCLCAIYGDTRRQLLASSSSTVRLYSRSLNSLRKCVQAAETRLEPETICSSLILQLCELLTSSDNGRWNNLSSGSRLLIQELGPKNFGQPFERAMLESQRAFFLAQDMDRRQRSFLSNPQWRKLPKQSGEGLPDHKLASHRWRSELCEILLDMPQVFCECMLLLNVCQAANAPHLIDLPRCQCLFDRVVEVYNSLEEWYEREVTPALPLVHPGGYREYSEVLSAIIDCVSTSVLVQLQRFGFELFSLFDITAPADGLSFSSENFMERRAISLNAFEFAKKFPMAAKPLQFGLQHILTEQPVHPSFSKYPMS
ncbi:uncharacterized protein TRUGW13939_04599 [Talaromyces rugulosus]|uniref:Zn(2)-C6 fungal-type domain-containing protein n=1 Tax=Talaromyces rugulosus TaxID=121627 RepID=A0A7H8QVH3_TALRU|nr:uncharacterized protein TRUGW13939_04599 [Talaromyces rugulosus]QKX57485.1 hypothetical protein TRUGW13939_04599 [Talaromyces rugulosus]